MSPLEALKAEVAASGREADWRPTQTGKGLNYRGRVVVLPVGDGFKVRFDNRFSQYCNSARLAVRVAHSLA